MSKPKEDFTPFHYINESYNALDRVNAMVRSLEILSIAGPDNEEPSDEHTAYLLATCAREEIQKIRHNLDVVRKAGKEA